MYQRIPGGGQMKKYTTSLLRYSLVIVLFAVAVASTIPAEPESLPVGEFVRLIRDISEEGGYFFSDNFTSNEDSYISVLDKMRELGATGGAYIGVGPEQNFTYIAKVRPRIAFIVDIRRQAMIQHLMYKAIFRLSPTRARFLSCLLSRPMPEGDAPGPDASVDEIVALFSNIRADDKAYAANLAAIRKSIQEEFQFPLSAEDQASLEYVYSSFRRWGFEVGFEPGGRMNRRFSRLPNLKDLLVQRDLNGKQGNFLASRADYDFVRDMQRRNLIIPIVGDFSGKKALAGVAAYLKKRGYTVSVFYLSNVEIVLLDWGSAEQFSDFVRNVKGMPSDSRSLLIRSTFSFYGHPARLPGYALVTLLQKMSVFLQDFNEGRYQDYRSLIMTHYIAPDRP
jgi:hypothetical protein